MKAYILQPTKVVVKRSLPKESTPAEQLVLEKDVAFGVERKHENLKFVSI